MDISGSPFPQRDLLYVSFEYLIVQLILGVLIKFSSNAVLSFVLLLGGREVD